MAKHTTPVLVIDDEVLMINIMTKILERLGYADVDYAADGLTALEKMRSATYGLVICDWLMAPISGYEVLRAVRGDPKLKDMPFIMATTETVMRHAVAAKTAGVDGYLIKPFTPSTLQRAIEGAIGANPYPSPEQANASAAQTGTPAGKVWSRR